MKEADIHMVQTTWMISADNVAREQINNGIGMSYVQILSPWLQTAEWLLLWNCTSVNKHMGGLNEQKNYPNRFPTSEEGEY